MLLDEIEVELSAVRSEDNRHQQDQLQEDNHQHTQTLMMNDHNQQDFSTLVNQVIPPEAQLLVFPSSLRGGENNDALTRVTNEEDILKSFFNQVPYGGKTSNFGNSSNNDFKNKKYFKAMSAASYVPLSSSSSSTNSPTRLGLRAHMVVKTMDQFSLAQRLKFNLSNIMSTMLGMSSSPSSSSFGTPSVLSLNHLQCTAMVQTYRWGKRATLKQIIVEDAMIANFIPTSSTITTPTTVSHTNNTTIILPIREGYSHARFPSPVREGPPPSPSSYPSTNIPLFTARRKESILSIRRRKMNKHKWKKQRRDMRNSTRYNRSKRKRNREKLREEAKELGLDF